ncbi:MAG: glycoside hydrolase family 26 protein [Thalassotalea sp.]
MHHKIKSLLLSTLLLPLIACQQSNSLNSSLADEKSQTTRPDNIALTAIGSTPRSVFIPPADKVLMFIGQDSETITDYIQQVPQDNIEGVTLYTNLKTANAKQALPAINSSANWRSGDVDFKKTLNDAPKAALAIGLAMDNCGQAPHTENIANGLYQASVTKLATYLKSLAPRKVFLRIGYEFDGPWNCYTPATYKKAYRVIVDELSHQAVTNVNTVWQSAAWPAGADAGEIYDANRPQHFEQWYPGDDYVDWVSFSVFYRDLSQWNYAPAAAPDDIHQAALTFARSHKKPVMIAESAPQGYRLGILTHSPIQMNQQTPKTAAQIWQAWFVPYFSFIEQNNDVIRAVAYINTHWETQGMWQCLPNIPAPQAGCNSGNWGDSRIQANPLIKTKWLEKVNNAAFWQQTADY